MKHAYHLTFRYRMKRRAQAAAEYASGAGLAALLFILLAIILFVMMGRDQ